MKNNTTLSIFKGIGIVLMVIGHSGCPAWLGRYIYLFHIPLFFMASGYFFNEKYISDKKTFLIKRIKGLYIPFMKWSLIFLLLHNLFIHIGILNNTYGSYLYSTKRILINAMNIIYRMGNYENALLGAFWFLRSLFVAGILFCMSFYLLRKFFKNATPITIAFIIGMTFYLVSGLKAYLHFPIPVIPQGGYRELLGVTFFSLGYIWKMGNVDINKKRWLYVVAAIILTVIMLVHPCSMSPSSSLVDLCYFSIGALSGCLLFFKISSVIDTRTNRLRRLLVYLGNNTMPILVFHFLCFKAVSLLKVYAYGMDVRNIGRHPIITEHNEYMWIVYTLVGIVFPLIISYLLGKTKYTRFLSFR
ncbi:acyltransferase family protein [Bacteroides sedimenti]